MNTCVVSPSVFRKSAWLRIWKSSGRPGAQLVLAAQDLLDLGHRVSGIAVLARGEHADRAQPVVAEDAIARRLERDQELLVRIAEAGA